MPLAKEKERGERREERGNTGETFVKKSFPRPFQKTLTGVLAVNGEYPKTLIEE